MRFLAPNHKQEQHFMFDTQEICCWIQAKGGMEAGQKLVRDPGSAFGVIPRITSVSGTTAA